ncbi:TraR/DksA family transcriptional regulator [Candidatus Azambacteria bacterium]|nr:TraR/DksA family transcriptional regulator [Candidatus Azambacteria bacterium]
MDKKNIEKLKNILEAEKTRLETELGNFTKKGLENERVVKNPDLGEKGADFSEEADQYEEFDRLLAMEHVLGDDLDSINLALLKIKNGHYGLCESCGEEINIKRLEINPQAHACIKTSCQLKFMQQQ